jgi:hypothetical protein
LTKAWTSTRCAGRMLRVTHLIEDGWDLPSGTAQASGPASDQHRDARFRPCSSLSPDQVNAIFRMTGTAP